MGSLETYVPTPRMITAGTTSIAVLPLKVRQIPAFTRALWPAMPLLFEGKLALAVSRHGDDLITAMSVATDTPANVVGDLLADEFLAVVAAVMEVNGDFFAQRVAPQIETMRAQLEMTRQATQLTPATPATSGATPLPS